MTAILRYAAGLLDAGLRDEAIAACRNAIELDSEDKQFVADLATILERKDQRDRFSDKAGLDEAIKLLDGISKDLPDLKETDRLPTDLFMARRFEEKQSFYKRAEGARSRGDLRIAGGGVSGSLQVVEKPRHFIGTMRLGLPCSRPAN